MANTMSVTLNNLDSHPYLVVDQNGNNEVPRETVTIRWNLEGNELAHAQFDSMDGDEKGFEWKSPQPDGGIFEEADPQGNHLTMQDDNTSANSPGTWQYILRVTTRDGVHYTTEHDQSDDTLDSPWIKNK